MKVVHVINSLGQGGAERSLVDLLPYMAERGVESTIVCFEKRDDGFHDEVVTAGFDVRVLPAGGMIRRVRALRRLTRQVAPDLIHTSLFDADVVGRVAAVRTGVPVVSSIVNMSYDPIRLEDPRIKRWKLEGARMLDGWTARHLGTHFHALTQAVKEAAVRDLHIASDRVTIIPRGRDPERLGTGSPERRARVRESLGLADHAEVVINVGRAEYQKGQRFLLDAMARLRRQGHEDVVLLIAGREGAESPALNRQVGELGLEAAVQFLGHRDDVPDLLACADVFAFPSLFEGFGGSLIEAMALGVPIVASDLAPLREVAHADAAQLIAVGSSEALADAISALLEDDEAAQLMGANGRRTFIERYTLGAVADAMEAMYRQVAG